MLFHYNASANGTYLLAIQRRLVGYLLSILGNEIVCLCLIDGVPLLVQLTYIRFIQLSPNKTECL